MNGAAFGTGLRKQTNTMSKCCFQQEILSFYCVKIHAFMHNLLGLSLNIINWKKQGLALLTELKTNFRGNMEDEERVLVHSFRETSVFSIQSDFKIYLLVVNQFCNQNWSVPYSCEHVKRSGWELHKIPWYSILKGEGWLLNQWSMTEILAAISVRD